MFCCLIFLSLFFVNIFFLLKAQLPLFPFVIRNRKETIQRDAMRQRLQRFFAFHEPSQLAVVDEWISNWEGHHDDMMRELIVFHGAEPPATYSTTTDRPSMVLSRKQVLLRECRGLLQQLILFYSPEDIGRVDEVLSLFESNEDDLLKRLETFASRRDNIFRYFLKNDPKHMEHAVTLAREWLGAEAHLVKYIAGNNGLEPTRSLPFPKLQLPESKRVGIARQRLIEFLKKYQPERLEDADAMLEAYRSREDEMFGMLQSKFEAPRRRPNVAGGTSAAAAGGSGDFVTSDFVWCVQLLAENWLASNPAHLEEVEDTLSKLAGTSISPGEVLLRLAAQTGGKQEGTIS
jgi:hypothetical protein